MRAQQFLPAGILLCTTQKSAKKIELEEEDSYRRREAYEINELQFLYDVRCRTRPPGERTRLTRGYHRRPAGILEWKRSAGQWRGKAIPLEIEVGIYR